MSKKKEGNIKICVNFQLCIHYKNSYPLLLCVFFFYFGGTKRKPKKNKNETNEVKKENEE